MIRYTKSSAAPLTRPGRSGLVNRSLDRVLVDGVDALDEVGGVEADLELLAGELDGERLLGLTDVLREGAHRELAVGERQAQRRVLLRQQADAPRRGGERRPCRA